LSEEPPPSIESVALQLGFKYVSSLYSMFPVLSRTLTAARRKCGKLHRLRVKAALRTAFAEDPTTTLQRIANRLGYRTPGSLRRWFPILCRTLAARGRKHQQKRLPRIKAALQAALKEEPPPVKHAVASKVGFSRGYLAMLFPHIWRRLGARSREHRKQEAEKRRQALRQEVREIVRGLLKAGTPPTRRIVSSMIARSPIKNGHLITSEIGRVKEELVNTGPVLRKSRFSRDVFLRGAETMQR